MGTMLVKAGQKNTIEDIDVEEDWYIECQKKER